MGADLSPGGPIWGLECWFEVWRADLKPWELIWGFKSWFEAWRADLRPGELIWGHESWFESLEGLNQAWEWGYEASMANRGGGWMEGRTDGRTDVWKFPLCRTGHRPFGAAAQKEREVTKLISLISAPFCLFPMNSTAFSENIFKIYLLSLLVIIDESP